MDLPEGKLYCENCGTELEIVSDIDMELEMNKTIRTIADEQFSTKKAKKEKDIEFDDDDNPSILGLLLKSGNKLGKLFYVIVAVIIVIVIIIAVKMGQKVSHESSLEYQIEMAEKAYEDNNLSQAITYLERAAKLDSQNSEYLFTIAEYYYSMSKYDNAVYSLTEIAENHDFDDPGRVKAYRRLFEIYKDNNDYSGINDALEKCDLKIVLDEYESYMVTVPEFNYEAGTYTNTISLTLSTIGSGVIYYTIDGSDPVSSALFIRDHMMFSSCHIFSLLFLL